MIITIDGPSGSGKSTVARKLARRLAFLYVNQGAFFRAVGLVAQEQGVSLEDEAAVLEIAEEMEFSLSDDCDNPTGLLVNGMNRSERLLSEEAGSCASLVAVHPKLRELLLAIQRTELGSASAVVEGRDAGSVGFPQAELKLFLDARAEIRARRRFQELKEHGAEAVPSVEAIAQEMRLRDERDRKRDVAPLSVPDDGVIVDTSDRTVEEVVEHLVVLAKERSDGRL